MEHEVFVPVAEERLRQVLDDPARVAQAVPGLQPDAGAEPVAGRLKVRVGSHSLTYRGVIRVSARDDGSYAVDGDAAEARGSGEVKLALRLRLRSVDDGTGVLVTGTAAAGGRVTELPREAVAAAVTRLLDRFGKNLGTAAAENAGPEAPAEYDAEPGPSDPEPAADRRPVEPAGTTEPAGPTDSGGPSASPELPASGDPEPRTTTGFETTPDADDGPPLSPEPDTDGESPTGAEMEVPPFTPGDYEGDDDHEDDDGRDGEGGKNGGIGRDGEDSVAGVAHARRTMIGRSAEEVDHAPPRGRYAPVPAPQTASPPRSLRWAAPAAALAVAGVVVAVRALRKRR